MALFQSLWIGNALSPHEIACIRSFLARGHAFRLYCDNEVANVPLGCEQADARVILAENEVFAYKHGQERGSYAGFANLFRYKLLRDRGGWWVDTDVVCLPTEVPADEVSLAREHPSLVNNAIMRFPAGHPAMQAAYDMAVAAGKDIRWGEMGPLCVTAIVKRFGLEPLLAPQHAFYPLHWSEYTALMLPERRAFVGERLSNAIFLHLWNEMFRRANYDKSVRPPVGSFLYDLFAETGVFRDFGFEYALMSNEQNTIRLGKRSLAR
jgi:Alpha 1,4-glycosyltransferase conserved region